MNNEEETWELHVNQQGKMKGHFQKMKYQEEKDKHELRKDTKKEEK